MERLFRNLTYDIRNNRIVLFIKNIWRFRVPLSRHQWWDYSYTLEMMQKSLQIISKGIEKDGHEIDEFRLKKVKAINRCIELIENKIQDNYLQRAEEKYGEFKFSLTNNPKLSSEEKRTNEKIMNHAKNLEISEWNELWRTIEGTSYTEWESYRDKEFTETQKKDAGLMETEYRKWYDGSDMRGWWD